MRLVFKNCPSKLCTSPDSVHRSLPPERPALAHCFGTVFECYDRNAPDSYQWLHRVATVEEGKPRFPEKPKWTRLALALPSPACHRDTLLSADAIAGGPAEGGCGSLGRTPEPGTSPPSPSPLGSNARLCKCLTEKPTK